MEERYTIGQFSKKTGTTIRTLHYYDEIGILNPEVTSTGRRIYYDKHLIILQKIITLKFLGYSLEKIKDFMKDDSWNLHDSLTVQRDMMLQKRKQIDHIIKALDHAIHIVEGKETIDPAIFVAIINGIHEEEEHKEWLNTIFPKDFVDSIYDIPESKQLEVEKQYAVLITDIKKMTNKSPDDPKALELIEKLIKLATDLAGKDLNTILSMAENTELDDPFPNPFSPEEEKWLEKAMDYYMNTFNKE